MSGYYPEGVTGNEPQIAGYEHDTEIKDDREVCCNNDECKAFEQYSEQEVYVNQYGSRYEMNETWEWTCPHCNSKNEFSRSWDPADDVEYEPDFD
jgi:hypothetical protein